MSTESSRVRESAALKPSICSSGTPVEPLDDLLSRKHEPNGVGAEAARDERQRARRLRIEPLQVVDHTQQWLCPRHLGQEAEGREADEVAIGRLARGQPEGHAQRVTLRFWQDADGVEHRSAQLVQTRVGEVDLTLDTHGSNDLEPGRRRDQLLQQRRLPDPRLAVHQQRTAQPLSPVASSA